MSAPVDVLAQVAGEMRKKCSCVVGGPNHGQCLNCDLSDRIEAARAALAELIEAATWAEKWMRDSGQHDGLSRLRAALARCKGEQP
jgi:hypothetical protein